VNDQGPAGRVPEPGHPREYERVLKLSRRLRALVRKLRHDVQQAESVDADAPALRLEPETRTGPGADVTPSAARASGERALLNTIYRSGGEVVGRLASLLLFAAAGRALGPNGLGAFVFAVAYMGFVMAGVNMGFDRYLLRIAARDSAAPDSLFFNVIALKLALAVPLFGAGFVVLHFLSHSHEVQATTWALAPGVLADSIARTQLSVFLARERSGPPALADALQRIISAGLGIAALSLGYGVVSVAVTYSIGSTIGVIVGFVLLRRTIGVPAMRVATRAWRGLSSASLPFATQDTFGLLLARVDTLILAAIATQAAVGRYGAAYRLFESSLLVTYAIAGAFAAMFSYLGRDTDPPLRAVYERSIKLSLVLLAPVAVAFAVLAEPICRAIYGPSLASAGVPLRILAPAVLLMAVVTLANSLLLSRENPRRMVSLAAAMAAVNVALNIALIPPFSDAGAAAAMVATELIYAVWISRIATQAVGKTRWLATSAGATAGAACMALVTLLLSGSLWIALTVGGAAYLVSLLAVERLVSSRDVQLVVHMLRRLQPTRTVR
jgi:O-antigen/teichoic acid export membrane protein